MKTIIQILCTAALLAVTAPTAAEEPTFTPEEILSDLDDWQQWLHSTHPQLTYTIKDIDTFYAELKSIRDGIDGPLTQDELWQRLTPLNTIFSDGHFVVGYASKTAFLKRRLKEGAGLFPYDVSIDNTGALVITSKAGGAPSEHRGYKIHSINGVPTSDILADILPRVNSDTDRQRRVMTSKRWSFLYLATRGSADKFRLTLEKNGTQKEITTPAHSDIEKTAYKTRVFTDRFSCEPRADGIAYLKVDSFSWRDHREYLDFMDQCFTTLKQQGSKALVVDVRENGGGNDDAWMAGILKYVAKVPYKQGGKYQSRILARYRDPGQTIGDIETGELTRMIQPVSDLENRFDGDFYLLIGPYTYSSSILFANAVKDHNLGTLVGTPTGGKRGQTGGTQAFNFANTGLRAVSPRFILHPPSGGDSHAPVSVDIPLDTEGLNREEALEAFMLRLAAED